MVHNTKNTPFPLIARNASANVDILCKCTIDEIRLRVISGLQGNLLVNRNIHKTTHTVLTFMEEAK